MCERGVRSLEVVEEGELKSASETVYKVRLYIYVSTLLVKLKGGSKVFE